MRHAYSILGAGKRTAVLSVGFLAWFGAGLAAGEAIEPSDSAAPAIERFTATTVSMTPAEIGLRIDVREWSDAAARAAVVAALAEDTGASRSLGQMPTIGYVWRSDSGVGYAVKYAHRAETAQGETVTIVTDKRLGAYDFRPWTADAGNVGQTLEYSVIELYLDAGGSGSGTLSLGAAVELDAANALVSLRVDDDAPRLLSGAKVEPRPYWAAGT
jgi:hypothetical protein